MAMDGSVGRGEKRRPALYPGRHGKVRGKFPEIRPVAAPGLAGTLCAIDRAAEVRGEKRFPISVIRIPLDPQDTAGIEEESIRVFRWDGNRYRPVWNSAFNRQQRFAWAKVRRPGTYVPIGLPRDRLLSHALRALAVHRRLDDTDDRKEAAALTAHFLRPFAELDPAALGPLRELVANAELTTAVEPPEPREFRRKEGGHVLHFPYPGALSPAGLRKRLAGLRHPAEGLPEEALFFPPDAARDELPWWPAEGRPIWKAFDHRVLFKLDIWRYLDIHDWFPWLFSTDWWMYQHDRNHTGRASGSSRIRSTTVHRLFRKWKTPVAGEVLTKPAIVDGKVYVGTATYGGVDEPRMYKIDLHSGAIDAEFLVPTPHTAYYSVAGIGGTPAVTGGRVYFTTVYGRVYCLDAASMAELWMTDLTSADEDQNQPINNPNGDSWSSPVVANGRLWVASGEGESSVPFGFVWCLDASDGHVQWVWCTNKFVDPDSAGNENKPNVIPSSAGASDPLPGWATTAGFSLHDDPPHKGAAPWSSPAYDGGLDRVYICTGNSRPDNPLPDERYASGLVALDASTGTFKGFFQPANSDGYHPGEWDVDVPGAPTLYTVGGRRVVGFGSKNGSYFVLDADTLAVVARRQLLARVGGTGLPGDFGTDAGVTDGATENKYGVMATAALHRGYQRLFIGLGGYSGIKEWSKTPFMRALEWDDLGDAWATSVGADNIARYVDASPPLYTSNEAGLASPAVVNDVVFMSTHKTALYALDVATGTCLWQATGLPAGGWPTYALGPAVSGDYVVMGTDHDVYCWKLPSSLLDIRDLVKWWSVREWPWREPLPPRPLPPPEPPGPGPDPPWSPIEPLDVPAPRAAAPRGRTARKIARRTGARRKAERRRRR